MTDVILTLNAGSSSLKFAIYLAETSPGQALVKGDIKQIGSAPIFSAESADGETLPKMALGDIPASTSLPDLIPLLLDWIQAATPNYNLAAAGHRVVHGGQAFTTPVLVNDKVIDTLESLISLAPLHEPHNISAIQALTARAPALPQIACFDTSFHQTQEKHAYSFALPRSYAEEGVIRYGFHGLSYDYIASILPEHLGERANGKIIVAHLGNGASMCAMQNRTSVATSMGFSALDGLMMGSRSGDLDPGVLLYMMQSKGMTASQIQHTLYHESGLLGVSGISNNMAVLETSTDARAKEAIELFCYRATNELCKLTGAIEGLDAIVFTAGIGENSANVRKRICDRLTWLGVRIDQTSNTANAVTINDKTSAVDVLVIPTNEEAVIAAATAKAIFNNTC